MIYFDHGWEARLACLSGWHVLRSKLDAGAGDAPRSHFENKCRAGGPFPFKGKVGMGMGLI